MRPRPRGSRPPRTRIFSPAFARSWLRLRRCSRVRRRMGKLSRVPLWRESVDTSPMPQQFTFTVTVDDPSVGQFLHHLQATITQAVAGISRSAGAVEPVPATADLSDQLLWDVRQVAKALGVSQRHVYRLADAGAMPKPVRLGNLVRWHADGLRKWTAMGCTDAEPSPI